jgi:anthranilate synthase component 2
MNKEQKILVVDNYDSFTYNLVHYIKDITGVLPDVIRNDKITGKEASKYDKILLSPGPGIPDEAGNLKEIIKTCASTKSIFGVCLGMQAIAEVFGGSLFNMNKVYHGISSPIIKTKEEDTIFNKVPKVFDGARYHSWIVNREGLPDEIKITAIDEEAQIMALKHNKYDVKGVQFHPESILTEHGKTIIENWINS